MSGFLAFVAFVLAVIFHGFGFAPNHWLDWTGLVLLGAALLCLHLLGVGTGMPVTVRRN